MSKLTDKIKRFQRMKDLTEQVTDELEELLRPVLGEYGYRHGIIESIYPSWSRKGYTTIEVVSHQGRGDRETYEYHIPNEVLEAEDLPESLRQVALSKERQQREEAEARRLARIKNLEDELECLRSEGNRAV